MPSELAGPETETDEPATPPFTMGKTEICPFSPLAYRTCGTAQASPVGPQQPLFRLHTFVPTVPHPPSASKPTRLVRISDSARSRIAPVDMAPSRRRGVPGASHFILTNGKTLLIARWDTSRSVTTIMYVPTREETDGGLQPEVAVRSFGRALARARGASHAGFHTVASGVLRLVHRSVGGMQPFLHVAGCVAGGHAET